MLPNPKLLTALTVLTLMFSAVAAETADLDQSYFEYFHSNLDTDELKQEINSNQDDIPGFAASIIGDQTINIEFQETNQTYSVVMEDTKIEEFDRAHNENATLAVYVNESTVDAVLESESPIQELKDSLDEGDIEYETMTRSNSVRMFITERVLDILSRFDVL